MISEVFLFRNGNVAVCDDASQQMPELQGDFGNTRDAILAGSAEATTFHHWLFSDPISLETFRAVTALPRSLESGWMKTEREIRQMIEHYESGHCTQGDSARDCAKVLRWVLGEEPKMAFDPDYPKASQSIP